MGAVFLKVLNMSIAASWLVLAAAVLRLLLKRAPKWISCVLWGVLALRLICPFSLQSALSLVPSAETVNPAALYAEAPAVTSGFDAFNNAVNPMIADVFAPTVGASANPLSIYADLAGYVWLMGAAVMLVYAAVSFWRLKKSVGAAICVAEGVWECDEIDTPFILGAFKPRIYLPSTMSAAQRSCVLAHERAHLKRRDHCWKPLGFVLLAVYWFNPLCWLAFALLCRDIELACDEKVISSLEKEEVIGYSEALLAFSAPKAALTACPLAFGEVGVRQRIKNALSYKKPAFWIIAAALAACVVTAVCFLTDPKKEESINWAERPTLVLGGEAYVDPYMPLSSLPYGYALAGELSTQQANDTGLEGCKYYTNPKDADSFYVYEICGTPIDLNTLDSEALQWAYKRWIKEGSPEGERLLTLDDVRLLAKKGSALTWSDFDLYKYIETGSGLYIRVYRIDELFSVWIGGGLTSDPPMYVNLRVDSVQYRTDNDYVDMRGGDVEGFIEAHKNDTPQSVAEAVFLTPLANGAVSREFSDKHSGIDFAASEGEPIFAANSGTVIFSGYPQAGDDYETGYGLLVVIDHGDFVSLYAHNSVNLVSAGDYVERGQHIAKVGSTGNSTGNHLHFELRQDGEPIDPQSKLD